MLFLEASKLTGAIMPRLGIAGSLNRAARDVDLPPAPTSPRALRPEVPAIFFNSPRRSWRGSRLWNRF